MGMTTKYTPELFDKILEGISTSSIGLKAICKESGIYVANFYKWIAENKELRDKYSRAREMQADFLADEMIEISDDGSNDYMTIRKGDKVYNVEDKEVTNRSKLRVETRKWIASKLKPKKYGEKLDITSDGEKVQTPVITTMVDGKVVDLKLK